MTTIYLDMDGVLTDFVGACLKEFAVEANEKGLTPEKVDRWSIEQLLGVSQDELWDRIGYTGFWADMKPYPWALALFNECRRHGEVVLLTSPGDCAWAAAGKLMWVRSNMPPVTLIQTKDKTHCAQFGRILIDDSDKNIDAWQDADGYGILFPQPWNRRGDLRSRPRFDPVTFVRSRLEAAKEDTQC